MSLLGRLYRSEFHVEFIARRKLWYTFSAIVIAISVISMIVRGFSLGIDFSGGAVFQFPAHGGTVEQAKQTVSAAGVNASDVVVQELDSAGELRVQTPTLDDTQTKVLQQGIVERFGLANGDEVAVSTVGASWGSTITGKALQGLMVFLVLVVFYLAIRFEWKMAAAAMAALIHDLVVTMGIYSLVGFEVTPSTVIALLTILGFSLYDTVVVFDRVRENTSNMGTSSKRTYAEATNDALNETLIRSLNTSLIALIPVASLLFVGAGLLGAGTLKDLALAQFVGIASGAYSSLFFATPLLVDLKRNEPAVKALDARVARTRAAQARAASQGSNAPGSNAPGSNAPGADARDGAWDRTRAGSARPTLAKKSGGADQPARSSGASRSGDAAGSSDTARGGVAGIDDEPTADGGPSRDRPAGGQADGLEPAGAAVRPTRSGRGPGSGGSAGSGGSGRRPSGRKPPRRGGSSGGRRRK